MTAVYSPDQAPSDFFTLLQMKRGVKEKRFANVAEVKKKTTNLNYCFEQ